LFLLRCQAPRQGSPSSDAARRPSVRWTGPAGPQAPGRVAGEAHRHPMRIAEVPWRGGNWPWRVEEPPRGGERVPRRTARRHSSGRPLGGTGTARCGGGRNGAGQGRPGDELGAVAGGLGRSVDGLGGLCPAQGRTVAGWAGSAVARGTSAAVGAVGSLATESDELGEGAAPPALSRFRNGARQASSRLLERTGWQPIDSGQNIRCALDHL
jgi:hypothetical protein